VTLEFYWLIIDILVVWRITHLLQGEDGPWNLLVRLRQSAGRGFWGGLLDCFYCLSLWVALPAALLTAQGWKLRLILWPALSGGAIILERVSSKNEAAAPIIYTEDKENENVLWQRQSATESDFKASQP
jgi:Protein of unknown function (DUF1360)